MRLLVLVGSAALTIVLLIFGINQISSSQDVKSKIVVLEENIQKTNQQLQLMRSFKEEPKTSLKKVFYKFTNMVTLLANFNKSVVSIGMQGYKEKRNIEEFFTQSELEGIKKINLKLTFRDLNDPLDSVSILTHLKDSASKYSFEIMSISSNFDKLEIIVNLFGV